MGDLVISEVTQQLMMAETYGLESENQWTIDYHLVLFKNWLENLTHWPVVGDFNLNCHQMNVTEPYWL